jgi:hypothetical protein
MPKRWVGVIQDLSALERMDAALEALREGCRQPRMHVMSGRDPAIPADKHMVCVGCGMIMIVLGTAAALPNWKQAQLRALHAIGWVKFFPVSVQHAAGPWYEPALE